LQRGCPSNAFVNSASVASVPWDEGIPEPAPCGFVRNSLQNHFIFPFDLIAFFGRRRRLHRLLHQTEYCRFGHRDMFGDFRTDQRSGADLNVPCFGESPAMDFRKLSRVLRTA